LGGVEQLAALLLVKPLAEDGFKDSHGPVIPTSECGLAKSASTPQPYPEIRVFIGDSPVCVFSVPEWEARDSIRRREATVLNTRSGMRGIFLVPKPDTHETQQSGGLAILEQVEGLPVAGPAIRLFYGKPKKAA
jgi:hypothetical protein